MIPQTEFTHFHNLKALAPERCQPFDKNRQGLMIGEGAGILIMERYEFAKNVVQRLSPKWRVMA